MTTPVSSDTSGTGCIDSLDAKIIQYQYGITKLQGLIPSLQKLLSEASQSKQLPLVQYAVLLAGNIFAINEGVFSPKLEILGKFKLFKTVPISVSNAVIHIPYDNADLTITPLSELPSIEMGIKCLKSMEELCYSCLQGYQKRLQQAKIEKEKVMPNSGNYFSELESILKSDILDAKNNVDLTLGKELLFNLPVDPSLIENADYIEACLIDMDIEMIFMITGQFKQTLDRLRIEITKFQKLKSTPKQQQENYVKSLSHWKLTLHKIIMLTLRLNDIYSMLRKFGRKVYFSNYQHLYDQRLASQARNPNHFKLQLLKEVDGLFNTTKKNGTLIANLTRCIRQNSKFEVNAKSVLDFSNFVNQGCLMIESMIYKFEEFGFNWIASELRFRKVYGLPKNRLIDIFQKARELNTDSAKDASRTPANLTNEYKAATTSKSAPVNNTNKTGENITKNSENKLEVFPDSFDNAETISEDVKKMGVHDLLFNRTSRSSSNSSVSSNSSSGKRTSLAGNRHSNLVLPVSKPANTSILRRNSAIFLNTNSSLSSIQTPAKSETKSATTTTPSGRRRSNSQPINPRGAHSLDIMQKATSGAAAALSKSYKDDSSVLQSRSPSGSISSPLRSPSTLSRSGSAAKDNNGHSKPHISSPSPISRNKPLLVVDEEQNSNKLSPKPLTANQRLQLHLRQATKSGALMTKQTEVLTSVVYDPNNSSSINFVTPDDFSNTSSVDPEAQSQIRPPTQAQTRDQVTKRNTTRNSVTPQLEPPASSNNSNSSGTPNNVPNTSESSFSTTSSDANDDSTPIKKVRFTGVPDYSELEDAPTKYASKLLKNFAVFKAPPSKPGFKSKDQLLKNEESVSFRTQLRQTNPDPFHQPQSGLSKFRNKLL